MSRQCYSVFQRAQKSKVQFEWLRGKNVHLLKSYLSMYVRPLHMQLQISQSDLIWQTQVLGRDKMSGSNIHTFSSMRAKGNNYNHHSMFCVCNFFFSHVGYNGLNYVPPSFCPL